MRQSFIPHYPLFTTLFTLAFLLSLNVTYGQVPTASISGSTMVSVGAADPIVTFTGNNGTPPYTFYYRENNVDKSVSSPSPTDGNKRLIFIHHSCGGQLLANTGNSNAGNLGKLLMDNDYYVSDICYGWSAPSNSGIGDKTDIGQWYTWFADQTSQNGVARRDNIMNAVYEEGSMSGQYGTYSRSSSAPNGENEIIMIKSCYPNSMVLSDNGSTASQFFGTTYNAGYHTLSNLKELYRAILPYMKSHPDKMFVILTAPPVSSATYASNARSFNNWLVKEWLNETSYEGKNVYVWDHYNVLTNAGNHHHVVDGVVLHVTVEGSGNTSAYPSGDDHPNTTGNQKAASEFVPCLNVWYDTWRSWLAGNTATVSVSTAVPSTSIFELTGVKDKTSARQNASGTVTITVASLTSLPDLKYDNIVVSPNPATTFFKISSTIPLPDDAIIKVYSINGKVVYDEPADGRSEILIPTDRFSDGFYIVKISSSAVSLLTTKLIINR